MVPTLESIRNAAGRIREYVHHTPIYTSAALDKICGAKIYLKAENMQKAGAFKARGAVNAVMCLTEKEACNGVATHSSGNHAAALAYAARCRGIKAYVVMPENAPAVKKAAVKSYGADIFYCEANEQAREAALKNVVKQTGATFIHPFNNYRVIEGQATAALEMLHDVSSLEAIIAPVGGGGLLSGTALAASYAATGIKVFGAEPQAADDAWQSLQEGRIIPANNPETIADGLRTSLGELTFAIIAKSVETIITVSEEEIIQAMRLIWERAKLVVEPSAAVALAAVTSSRHKIDAGSIGLIISGGNVDLDNLPW